MGSLQVLADMVLALQFRAHQVQRFPRRERPTIFSGSCGPHWSGSCGQPHLNYMDWEWFPREAVIKHRHAPASPGRLMKTQTAGPCLWNSLSVGLGWSLRTCISDKSPGHVTLLIQDPHPGKQCPKGKSWCWYQREANKGWTVQT